MERKSLDNCNKCQYLREGNTCASPGTTNGFVNIRPELGCSRGLPKVEAPKVEKNCGTCQRFKGPKVPCGAVGGLIPQSETDGCHGRAYYISRVAQRWVDEYKAETGVDIPVEALQKDIDETIRWNGIRQLPAKALQFGAHVAKCVSKDGSYFVYLDKNRTRVPESIASELKARQKGFMDNLCSEISFPDRDHYSFAIKASGIGTYDHAVREMQEKTGLALKFKGASEFLHPTFPLSKAATSVVANSLSQKENINMNAIIRLADSQLNKDMEEFGALPIDIREALVGMQETAKKDAAQAAAKEVMALLSNTSKQVEYKVNEIRSYRKSIDGLKDGLEAISRAKAYGLETSNFIPLAILAGQISASSIDNKDLTKVPEDWKPAEYAKAVE